MTLELLAINAQKFRGSRDPGHAPFSNNFKGVMSGLSVGTCMLVKFEVRIVLTVYWPIRCAYLLLILHPVYAVNDDVIYSMTSLWRHCDQHIFATTLPHAVGPKKINDSTSRLTCAYMTDQSVQSLTIVFAASHSWFKRRVYADRYRSAKLMDRSRLCYWVVSCVWWRHTEWPPIFTVKCQWCCIAAAAADRVFRCDCKFVKSYSVRAVTEWIT